MKPYTFPYPYSTLPNAPKGILPTAPSVLNNVFTGDTVEFTNNWLRADENSSNTLKIPFHGNYFSGVDSNYKESVFTTKENVVSNAIKYLDERFPKITISSVSSGTFSSFFSESVNYTGPYEFDGFLSIHKIPSFEFEAGAIDKFFYGFTSKTYDGTGGVEDIVFGILIDGVNVKLVINGIVVDSGTLSSSLKTVSFPEITFLKDSVDGYLNKVPSGVVITLNETTTLETSSVVPINTYNIKFFTEWDISLLEEITISGNDFNLYQEVDNVNDFNLDISLTSGGSSTPSVFIHIPSFSTNPVPGNTAPVITSVAPTTFVNETLFNYQLSYTDEEVGGAEFFISSSVPGPSISSTGLISWIPNTGEEDVTVEVLVTDVGGLVSSQSFVLSKQAVSIEINSSPSLLNAVLVPYTYQITTNLLTGILYEIVEGPQGMVVNPSTGLISWTPTDSITDYNITVRVSKDGTEDTQSFTIHVFRPIHIESDLFVEQISTPFSVQLEINETQTVSTFSFVDTPPVSMTIDPETGVINWAGSESKTSFVVSVNVSDEYSSHTKSITFKTFIPISFLNPPEDFLWVSETGEFVYELETNDTGELKEFSFEGDPGGGNLFNNGTVGFFVIFEADFFVLKKEFTIKVTDGFSSDFLTVTVIGATEPFLTIDGPREMFINEQKEWTLNFPSDEYDISFLNPINGMSIVNNSLIYTPSVAGTVSPKFILTNKNYPTYSVTSDDYNLQIISIKVYPELKITSTPPSTEIRAGDGWSYTISLSQDEYLNPDQVEIIYDENYFTFTFPTLTLISESAFITSVQINFFIKNSSGEELYRVSEEFELQSTIDIFYETSPDRAYPPVRVGDVTSGHGKYPPQFANAGSPDVFINGKPVMRAFDDWDGHSCSSPNCYHDGTVVFVRNKTVFVNDLPMVTVGDALDCGSVCGEGSPDVFVGGQ